MKVEDYCKTQNSTEPTKSIDYRQYEVRILYDASPFFTPEQIDRENRVVEKLRSLGYVVIRPKELGVIPKDATDEERSAVMKMDLEAINRADAVFAITNDKDMGCFEGNTKIKLMSGTSVPIKDLVPSEEGYWVYSVNKETNKIEPGFTHGSVLTKKNSELVKVVLDNDEEIICTPDHPFMIRDKSYKNAEDLRPGESLMTLYSNTDEDLVVGLNHSVKLVTKLDYTADVYGIQVDSNHNYALGAGVFVSNTMIECGYAIATHKPVIYFGEGFTGKFNLMLAATGSVITSMGDITREFIDNAIDYGRAGKIYKSYEGEVE